jgi:hypothetical protein
MPSNELEVVGLRIPKIHQMKSLEANAYDDYGCEDAIKFLNAV